MQAGLILFPKQTLFLLAIAFSLGTVFAADSVQPFPTDPLQALERTCFQTGSAYSGAGNLRSDVAIVYGIDAGLPARIQTWKDRGYRIHVMSGVSWGNYQDYLYGRYDGTNHEDEAQTDRNGKPLRHGNSKDVFYMCPGENYGKYLCIGVQRALDAGVEAIHLEEPEFWVNAGYSEGFKREWLKYYGTPWQPPHESVDAQWRSSKLKYFLYRRALQQIFDYVRQFNERTGRHVRCYVPTHSLINYSHWKIVSPESSLAQLAGCDGYIAQVWTGTSRTPNLYRGQLKERTFETAFLEYGAMQNLVRSTGRTVWYLNDPVEDNPDHDWEDYRVNWESTLTASLFQPDVWRFEVAPWPERVFAGRYPRKKPATGREGIPSAYATELQVVMNTLNDMNQSPVEWDCGASRIGIMVSDSLMFQRGNPSPSDRHMSHLYGLALPLLKRGIPVTPVQLENIGIEGYLKGFDTILMSYHGMKPLSEEVHAPLIQWVKKGGALVFCDDDSDPYNRVTEWWNSKPHNYSTPRQHLFKEWPSALPDRLDHVGKGIVYWIRANPASFAQAADGGTSLIDILKKVAQTREDVWKETNYLLLRRGKYRIAAGLDESIGGPEKVLQGRFINLFDPLLRFQNRISLMPGSRWLLLDLDDEKSQKTQVLASGCKALPQSETPKARTWAVEGVPNTEAIVLFKTDTKPASILLDQQKIDIEYDPSNGLVWVKFTNTDRPRMLCMNYD